MSRKPLGAFWTALLTELGFVGLVGLALAPFAALEVVDEDWFFPCVLMGYLLLVALRRTGEGASPAGRRRAASGASDPSRPAAEESSAVRGLSALETRLMRARARARRGEGAESEVYKTLNGLVLEYRQTRHAVHAGTMGAEAQAARLRRVGGSLAELAQEAAAAPGSDRGAQAAEALRDALERLREQRSSLNDMADEAAFEANLQTLRRRLPEGPPRRAPLPDGAAPAARTSGAAGPADGPEGEGDPDS